jgi:hypothetical protein
MVRAFGKCVRVCHKDFYGVCVFDCALAHYYGLVFNIGRAGNTNGGSITVPLTSCLIDLESNFCFYLPNRLIQTSQTGGQWYSDTPLFCIPWAVVQDR